MASIEESVDYTYRADVNGFVTEVDKANKSNKDFEDSSDKANQSSKNMTDTMKGGVSAISGYVAVVAAAVVAVVALGNASDTAVGNIAKVEAVYADAAVGMGAVEEAAANLGNTLGVTTQEILLTASSMAVTAENMGFAEEQAEKYGAAVAKLTSVCASYLNIPMADAAERVTAAMRGEAEAAEALGLSLGQTAMTEFVNQQIAAGAAINKTYGEMSAQEQMVVRLIAAIDQMANTMGEATPEVYTLAEAEKVLANITSAASEEVTNQQKVTATLTETFNSLLVAIQPVKDALVLLIGTLLGGIAVTVEAILTNEHFAKIFKILAATVLGVITALTALTSIILKLIDVTLDWISTNEKAQKIIEIVAKVVVVLGATIVALIGVIAVAIENTIAWYQSNEELQKLVESLGNAIVILTGIISGVIAVVATAITKFASWAAEAELLQTVLELISIVIPNIVTWVNSLISVVTSVISKFKAWFSEAELLQGILEGIQKAVEGISDAIQTMIGWINDAIDAFQELRAQDFGSDLVNIGASSSTASVRSANSQASVVPQFTGSTTQTTKNVFHITAKNIPSFREAYRQSQLARGRGKL